MPKNASLAISYMGYKEVIIAAETTVEDSNGRRFQDDD